MKRAIVFSLAALLLATSAARADYVILRDGKSYSGAYTGAADGRLKFKDGQGIQYTFPLADVQSLVFSNVADHISLRGGQSYTGQLMGATSIQFRGANGISYVFPLSDVASLVITGGPSANGAPMGAGAQGAYAPPGAPPGNYAPAANYGAQGNYGAPAGYAPGAAPPAPRYAPASANAGPGTPSIVIPSGTQIVVRTDVKIDTTKDAVGKLYPAQIAQDIVDGAGAVAIPSGTNAKLEVVNLNQNTGSGGSDLALDLYSVEVNGAEYRVDSSSIAENGKAGYGLNRRTAEYAGGGAGLGALMGAVFGGGTGAGVGTLAGGGVGALAQFLTRGKKVQVPAESTLTFQLEQTMVLHP